MSSVLSSAIVSAAIGLTLIVLGLWLAESLRERSSNWWAFDWPDLRGCFVALLGLGLVLFSLGALFAWMLAGRAR